MENRIGQSSGHFISTIITDKQLKLEFCVLYIMKVLRCRQASECIHGVKAAIDQSLQELAHGSFGNL